MLFNTPGKEKMNQTTLRQLYAGVLFASLISVNSAFASGFRIPEASIAGLASSNALVADTSSPGALPYNPAAMSFQDKRVLIISLINVRPTFDADPDIGTATDSEGASSVFLPSGYFMDHINAKTSWGISVNTPFGLETQWPDETFAAFAGATDAFEPEQSKLELVNINPNIAYRIDENTSLAFGIDYHVARKLIFNTQALKIEGDGQAFGWNIGLQHKRQNWSFGLSYRSSVSIDIDGSVDATSLGLTKTDASTTLDLPDLLQVGVRYQVNPQWAVEFDIERTGWSSFDVIEIDHSVPVIPDPITSANNWKNSTAYRLGGTFQANPTTQYRFGYAQDGSPQGETDFSPRIPDGERQTLSAGFSHDMGDYSIEMGYMVAWLNRTIDSSAAYSGKYESKAQLLGLGLSSQF
jgi:long-chain fatty acid transport protein